MLKARSLPSYKTEPTFGALHLPTEDVQVQPLGISLGFGARWGSGDKGGVPILSPVIKSSSLLLPPMGVSLHVGVLRPFSQAPGAPFWQGDFMNSG